MRHRALTWSVGGLAGLMVLITATTSGVVGADKTYPSHRIIDLAASTEASVIVGAEETSLSGVGDGEVAGHARPLAIADLNGDGVNDVAVGAPEANLQSLQRSKAGQVYIIFGKHDIPATIDAASEHGPDLRVFGASSGDELGFSLAAGDINGDGIGDLAMGAPGRDGSGALFVILGSRKLARGTIDLANPGAADIIIHGAAAGSRLGSAIALGKRSSPQYLDLLIGAPSALESKGIAYFVPGGARMSRDGSATMEFDLNGAADVLSVMGGESGSFGSSVAIGDIDADGLADLIIGAPFAEQEAGVVYVVSDEPSSSRVGVSDTDSLSLRGQTSGDRLGIAVAADDVTGDGIADLLLGAPGADAEDKLDSGEAYIIAGGHRLRGRFDVASRSLKVLRIQGAQAGDQAGSAVAAARYDGDPIADILVGAPADTSRQGSVSILYGGAKLLESAVLDLALGGDDVRVLGAEPGDGFGWTIAASDIGARYLIAGAPRSRGGGDQQRRSSGKVFLVPQVQPPTVLVRTPNGGELVEIGRNFNITWTASDPDNDIASYTVQLSTDGGASFPLTLAQGLPGSATSFNWQVNVTFSTFSARVRVIVRDAIGGQSQDDSDGNFTIVDNGVAITLTRPNGGETLSFGQFAEITWNVPATSRSRVAGFDLFFSTDGGNNFTQPVVTGVSGGSASFFWQVPPLCATRVRLLIVATTLAGARTTDVSDGDVVIINPGPTVDISRMLINQETTRLQLTTVAPATSDEIIFTEGTLVEFSTDEDGSEFMTFDKTPKIKKGGRRLITRGLIESKDLIDFIPLGATRIMRITTPACGVTQVTIRRFGFQLFAQQ